jgi:hypothetical protein
MSGVGEVIAIVSCVAGLIEALDAGVRIVKQIKARRAAHRADGALPPSDELEKTIEEGKENIQKLVEKGNHRFGPNFEEGDGASLLCDSKIYTADPVQKRHRLRLCASPSRFRTCCSIV